MGSTDGNSDESVIETYNTNMQSYVSSGVPEQAWVAYFLYTFAIHPFIFVFTPVAVRLYGGHGYWKALSLTLSERHLASYTCDVALNMANKFTFLWLWV